MNFESPVGHINKVQDVSQAQATHAVNLSLTSYLQNFTPLFFQLETGRFRICENKCYKVCADRCRLF